MLGWILGLPGGGFRGGFARPGQRQPLVLWILETAGPDLRPLLNYGSDRVRPDEAGNRQSGLPLTRSWLAAGAFPA